MRPQEPVSLGNRIAGGILIALGLLAAVGCISTLAQMRDDLDRNSAIATGALAVALFVIGGVVGFRDYLPKQLVATIFILLGGVSIVGGIILLGWIGYNVLVERQPEFQWRSPRQFLIPFVMLGAGYGFVTKGIARMK